MLLDDGSMVAVTYSIGAHIGGGGCGDVAVEVVRGLLEHGLLQRLLVLNGSVTGAEDRTSRFPARLVRNRLANRFLPDFLRDAVFDRWASRRLGHCDLFFGWTGQALHSIRSARRAGAVTFLEREVAEVRTQKRLLDEEHRRYGLPAAPLFRQEIERIVAEYDEADVIAVPSKFVYDSFRDQGYPESKLWLCPLGVDTTRFAPSPQADRAFRVLFLGRIGLQKGIIYLLRAWRELALPRAELVILGPPGSPAERAGRAVILREMEQMNRRDVWLVPPTSQPETALRQASVLVLPSVQDGFGLVVLEAMACGIPVIVSDHVGAKDCVRDGVDGFVCPVRDAPAIAEALQRLHDDPALRFRMGQHAREQAMRFTWDRYRAKLLARIAAAAPGTPQAGGPPEGGGEGGCSRRSWSWRHRPVGGGCRFSRSDGPVVISFR